MSIIYRKTDLIKLQIGDLIFSLKPLSYLERTEIMGCLVNNEGEVVENAAKATFLAIRYTIRKIDGATLSDGSKYELEFNEAGNISDECIDDLLNIDTDGKLGLAITNFLKGIPSKLIDPNTNKELKGVKIILGKGVPKK